MSGDVTTNIERKSHSPELHPTEPYVWFRAQDLLAPYAFDAYITAARAVAHGLDHAGDVDEAYRMRKHAEEMEQIRAAFVAWQAAHPERVRLPD